MQKIGNEVVSTSEFEQTASSLRMGVTNGWIKNYVVNPLATDGRLNVVTSSDIKSDNEFGQVVELANDGGDWQLYSVIDSSYEELTGKTVTWYCIVKAVEKSNVSPYNCKLHFGTGANETIRNLHAIVMTATYTSATTPMTIEAVSNLNTSYYKDISYGQQKIGENGWYICWVSATPRSSSRTIIDSGTISDCGFNCMEGKWQLYYGGVVLGSECPSVDVIRESGNLKRTGIDISQGLIRLSGGKVEIEESVSVPTVLSENDVMYTQISAGSLEIHSKTTSSFGVFEINNLGEVILSLYDKDGLCLINIGGSPDTIVSGEWITWKLKKLDNDYPSNPHLSDGKTFFAATDGQCSSFYQLKLGQLNNTGSTLKYFTPCGLELTPIGSYTDIVELDLNVFVSKPTTTYRNVSSEATAIRSLVKITNGYYVMPNDGRFEVEANQYGPTNYKVTVYYFNNGKCQIITQRFSL